MKLESLVVQMMEGVAGMDLHLSFSNVWRGGQSRIYRGIDLYHLSTLLGSSYTSARSLDGGK
jgi:hypothetical protein